MHTFSVGQMVAWKNPGSHTGQAGCCLPGESCPGPGPFAVVRITAVGPEMAANHHQLVTIRIGSSSEGRTFSGWYFVPAA